MEMFTMNPLNYHADIIKETQTFANLHVTLKRSS